MEGPGYGGHYVDIQKGTLYIYLVNPSQEAAEEISRTLLREVVRDWNIQQVRPVQAPYTIRQLDIWFRQLSEDGRIHDIPGVDIVGGHDGLGSGFLIGIVCESDRDRVQRTVLEQMAQLNIPESAAIFEVYGGYPQAGFRPTQYECAPPEVIDPVTGTSSPGFGGLFRDRESGILNVYMLEPSQQKAEELALQIVGKDTLNSAAGVRALQGQYTWEQLLEWDDRLRKPVLAVRGANNLAADSSRNRLIVSVNRELKSDVEAEVEELLEQLGIPREAVVLLE